MRAPSHFKLDPEEALGVQGESEWARLCQKLQEGTGFSLVFLFSASARSAQVLLKRMEALLQKEGKGLRLVGTVRELTHSSAEGSANGHGTWGWIEAPGAEDWSGFLAQLEVSLQTVRQKLPGGLVVSALPLNQKDLEKTAPHLKEGCALLLQPLPTWLRPLDPSDRPLEEEASFSPTLSSAAPDAQQSTLTVNAETVAEDTPAQRDPASFSAERLLAQAQRRLSEKNYQEARLAAQQALEAGKDLQEGQLSARIHYCLACVERASHQDARALEHVEQALESANCQAGAERLKWFDLAAQLRLQAGDPGRALQHCRQGVALARSQPPGHLAQRDFAVILSRQGDVHLKQREMEEAQQCLRESVEVRRGLLRRSKTAQSMRDLSYSLYKMGIFQVRGGELEAAHKLTEESLYLDRKIIEMFGPTGSSVRDYAASLRLTATILERLERKEPARLRRRQAERLEEQLRSGT